MSVGNTLHMMVQHNAYCESTMGLIQMTQKYKAIKQLGNKFIFYHMLNLILIHFMCDYVDTNPITDTKTKVSNIIIIANLQVVPIKCIITTFTF